MDARQMLAILAEHGEDAGSDYNDGEDVDGYFGWTVEGIGDAPVLVVTHRPGDGGEVSSRRFRLVEA
jgi:hypothetical protein